MPGKIKVKVLAGRNLPVMDRASETTDAFVEIKFGGVTHKTDVCRKSLNPHWNSAEWYRFEVDEWELQDEPLQLRLMDHDTYSANDAIGKIVLSLAPLLASANTHHSGAMMSGWLPVFDTLHGIRGELNIVVKVELFSDCNKYKTSSCGVQFYHCPSIPPGSVCTGVHGFVEELVVNADPEYQWIDKIRTPRASNEARQVAFIKLSNQVQRLVGVKAAELGANAVVGYQQHFDLEGEAGVVARAIGTAVSLAPPPAPAHPLHAPPTQQQLKKCLDILATDNEDVTDLNEYFQTHQGEVEKLLRILNPKTGLDDSETMDDEEENSFNFTRKSSVKTYSENFSIYQDDYATSKSFKNISEDQTELNKLLHKSDDKSKSEEDSDSSGTLNKIKKMKSAFTFRKMSSRRARKSAKQDDTISLRSNSSDASKLSLVDEIVKFKRLKPPNFRKIINIEEEGEGMASILARSILHAHTSLACIAETQTEHSPASTLRRTSESEPTINLSDEEKITSIVNTELIKEEESNKSSPEKYGSLKNIRIEIVTEPVAQRKMSVSCPSSPLLEKKDNFLNPGYSVSSKLSVDSSEPYSSSDEDDDSSDMKSDSDKSIETTSLIVKSVLSNEVSPQIVTRMDRNLSIVEGENLEFKADKIEITNAHEIENNTNAKIEESLPNAKGGTVNQKSNNHFKFHNPFQKKIPKSMSVPSSPVEKKGFIYRSSNKIKRQLSKISNNRLIKSISHLSLSKKKVEPKPALSQPSSSSDVPSKTSKTASRETVLGSPFLSYSDLFSLDKEGADVVKPLQKNDEFGHSKVSMYIGSEPVSRASLSGPSSPRTGKDDFSIHELHTKPSVKASGLIHTAMETILMEKVHSLLVPTSPDSIAKDKQFFDYVTEKLEKVEQSRSDSNLKSHSSSGLIKTAMETMLMDKASIVITEDLHQNKMVLQKETEQTYAEKTGSLKGDSKSSSSSGIIKTAMETILMDKASLLIPDDLQANMLDLEKETEQTCMGKNVSMKGDSKSSSSSGLVKTAVETMLMDNKSKDLQPNRIDSMEETELPHAENTVVKEDSPQGLLKTALTTMLIDNAALVIPQPISVSLQEKLEKNLQIQEKVPEEANTEDSEGLLQIALTTMLADKAKLCLPSETNETSVSPNLLGISKQTIKIKGSILNASSDTKKLVRQDSIHSNENDEPLKMSKPKPNIVIPCKIKSPVLQHFHPILSGLPKLETISSITDSSFDRSESLDVEGVERLCDNSEIVSNQIVSEHEPNRVVVCDNSHAACDVDRDRDKESPHHARHESVGGREPSSAGRDFASTNREAVSSGRDSAPTNRESPAPTAQHHNVSLNSSSTPLGIHRRSSDSDLSVTPKGGSLNTSGQTGSGGGGAILRPSMNSHNLELLEYPFLTMTHYPPGFIVHIGGTVCARSVKLIEGGVGAGEGSAGRAAWWAELRTELRAHSRALRCNAVIAYSETAAICEDVCVVSASGTAAVINLDCDYNAGTQRSGETNGRTMLEENEAVGCSMAHVPYAPGAGPYVAELEPCATCRSSRVPTVLLATCALPATLHAAGPPIVITAVAGRVRRAQPSAEPGARDISDQLPFLEYELHKLLLAKLRMQGANAVFSLQTQIAVGERCVMALATGSAVKLVPLPVPAPPIVNITNSQPSENDKEAVEIQKQLRDAFNANITANGFDGGAQQVSNGNGVSEILEGKGEPLELSADRHVAILQLDEHEDVQTARLLCAKRARLRVFANGERAAIHRPPHAFVQVLRGRLSLSGVGVSAASGAGERAIARALEATAYKLRRLYPYALGPTAFSLDLPEDEIQLVVCGAAIPLAPEGAAKETSTKGTEPDDDIFALDEEQLHRGANANEKTGSAGQLVPIGNGTNVGFAGVCMTSLPSVDGARSTRRVCALRLLFIRETTAVRELGGMSGFLHTTLSEALCVVRATCVALGGNALTSFHTHHHLLQDNAHKNQGQCLLSVGGDVVHLTY